MEMGQRRNRRDERDDLRYTMQKNDGSDKHRRKDNKSNSSNETWSIGERLFKEDFGRRMKIFDALVGSSFIRCKNMGMERRGRNGQNKKKIHEMGART